MCCVKSKCMQFKKNVDNSSTFEGNNNILCILNFMVQFNYPDLFAAMWQTQNMYVSVERPGLLSENVRCKMNKVGII